MIAKEFYNGWPEYVKLIKWQKKQLDLYLEPMRHDHRRFVILHNLWFTDQYADSIRTEVQDLDADVIAVVSFMDPPGPAADVMAQLAPSQLFIGSYRGVNHLDAFAVIMDDFMPNYDHHDLHGTIDTAFMCLNRKPHAHRLTLYQQLSSHHLLDKGFVSMGNDGSAWKTLADDVKPSYLTPGCASNHYGVPSDIVSLGNIDRWRRHFLNVVTETNFWVDDVWFVSEKIYKPIIGERPFLVYSPGGARRWLHEHDMLDYCDQFRDITDLDLTEPENIAPFLNILCQQPISYLRYKYLDLHSRIQYNKIQFQKHVVNMRMKLQQGVVLN